MGERWSYGVTIVGVVWLIVGLCQSQSSDDAYSVDITTPGLLDESTISENEIAVFPSTTLRTNKGRRPSHYNPKIQNFEILKPFIPDSSSSKESNSIGKRKNFRLMNFLKQFQLDFAKFDTSCVKRGGRGVPAPVVANGYIAKYTRKRNPNVPRNRYGLTMYKCDSGFEFPPTSADRMFCSKNKWVGPRPVCLPKGTLENSESDCTKCNQICNRDENEPSTTICACYAGYEMANGSCADVDECANNNGGCSGICFNKPGSFQCFCPPGFQVAPDGKKCIDKNECLLRNGHGPCQDRCSNTIGHYTCSCELIPGTRLAADKHSCEDINECEENNFGCSHSCLNTFGNAFCSCPTGFTLSTLDYKTCISDTENESESDKVVMDFSPENLVEPAEETVTAPPTNDILSIPEIQSSRQSECPPGSEPDSDNPQICVEHEDCSIGNGGCDHICVPSGSFRFCSCRPGHELLNETACVDVNECLQENGGCDHQCVNTDGSFYCDCKSGHMLLEDKRTCKVEYCQEPPKTSRLAEWDCEISVGSDAQPISGDLRPIGTRCKLQCQAGTVLQTKVLPVPSYINIYHPFHYEIVSDEPQPIIEKEDPLVIKCLATGVWSQNNGDLELVTCMSPNCPRLTEPEHGSLFPESCLEEEGVQVGAQCFVSCSPGYYPKNGRLRTCSKSLTWFPEERPVCLKLPPTPRPQIHCPSDLVVDLKAGQSSAHVIIPQPQANMDWYRYVQADPPWAKSLEWDVPAGITVVVFTARSPISNDSATCHFRIHIVDREAPRVQGCPTSFDLRLDPSETSKEVWWSDPKFTDNVQLHYVQQSHTPGHLLAKGTHHITYVAGDAEGNKARCAFTITVHGPESYEMSDHSFYASNVVGGRHMIICPNLKTGRWNVHFAYYLPPGCRYHSPQYGFVSKVFNQNLPATTQRFENFGTRSQLRRRAITRTFRPTRRTF